MRARAGVVASRVAARITAKEAIYSAVGLVLFLQVIKTIASFIGGYVAQGFYTLAAVAQLYYPIYRLEKLGAKDPELELGLRQPDWGYELRAVGVLVLLTFVPFAVAHHFYWTEVFHYRFGWGVPDKPITLVLTHLIGVALPEEVFYRGYVQPRMASLFAKRWRFLGVEFGWEIPVTSALFALGHFAGEYDPSRLGPFFPGLLFGFLRARSGGLWGAILYHAMANVFSAFLFACYHA